MTRSRADVVLLNSDTIVTAGWLDALRRCADADPRIGTITPFSNNAEICSFPRFCEDNPWPLGDDPEPRRAPRSPRAAVPTYPDLPTGVGFCMYVRRALLDAIGAFDMAFGAGYGEENDFCLRAARAGWRNVLADDAFVVHTGGRSFAGQKDAARRRRNMALLLERHPHYLRHGRATTSPPIRCARCARRRCSQAARASAPGSRRAARDPRPRRRHGDARARADRRVARPLAPLSRHRGRRRWQVEEHRADGAS